MTVYYKRNNIALSRNHFCRGKSISVTYSEYVSLALFIQHANRMRQIVVCLTAPYFTHYLINGTIFGEKNLLDIKCVF